MVLATTMMMTGAKKTSGISPSAAPLLATIKATSPRQTMPTPICSHWWFFKPHSLAPSPHPRTLVSTATMTSRTEKRMSLLSILGRSTSKPMLAKKIGVSSR